MGWNRKTLASIMATAAVMVLVACSGGPAEDPLAEDWAAVQAAKSALEGKRQELADMVSAASVEGAEDMSAQIGALGDEIATMGETFSGQVVAFINADPMIEGEPPTERQVAAIRMKSAEDIVLAQEWIDQGGDYKRALDIYNASLMIDPDNDDLKAAIAKAEAERYMDTDRFALAAKGMTEDDVRARLGQPLQYNVRSYEDNGVTAWFYPTAENGAAAGVWFRADKEDVLKIYQVKYEAVPGKEAAE